MHRTLLLVAACLWSCTPTGPVQLRAEGLPRGAAPAVAAAAPAGDLDAAAIQRLRAEGPAGLERVLAAYDRSSGTERERLAVAVDRVAAQRYASVSRLYWYTDLEAAKKAARESKRPILSLRMLGRLDEELSCANSRMFRAVLYANRDLSKFLREHFVLHWSSERPVPKVTIDFGDGRKILRTLTGNSAHYVLDADGRPLDVLPGLYAPAVFRSELARALDLVASIAPLGRDERALAIQAHHTGHIIDLGRRWQTLGPVISTSGFGPRAIGSLIPGRAPEEAVIRAQEVTVTKAYFEIPDVRLLDLGMDLQREATIDVWAGIGSQFLPPGTPLGVLDEQSRELVVSMVSAGRALPAADVEALLHRLDATVLADTARNELLVRNAIEGHLVEKLEHEFTELDDWIYSQVFHTPQDDRWLGLVPRDAFMALPADGVISSG
jgi:hypothetical protein